MLCLFKNIALCYSITKLILLYKCPLFEAFHGIELSCVLFLNFSNYAKGSSAYFLDYLKRFKSDFLASWKQGFIFSDLFKIFSDCYCLRQGNISFMMVIHDVEIGYFLGLLLFLFFSFAWRVLKQFLLIDLKLHIWDLLISCFRFIFSLQKHYLALLRRSRWQQFLRLFIAFILNIMRVYNMLVYIANPDIYQLFVFRPNYISARMIEF